MFVRVALGCSCAGVSILLFSLYHRGTIAELSNGFYTRAYRHWDGTSRLSLYLERHGDCRLITEAIVSDGVVLSLMPTIETWGTPDRWNTPPIEVSYDVASVSVLANGKLLLDGKPVASSDGCQALPDRVRRQLIFMSIATPIDLADFAHALESGASVAEVGLLVLKKEGSAGERGRSR